MTASTKQKQHPAQSLLRVLETPAGDVARLAEMTKELLGRNHPSNSTASILALRFYQTALGSTDVRVILGCLGGLLTIGSFGSLLAARLVLARHVPTHDMEAAVSGLTPARALALLHELLLDFPGQHDRQTQEWLEGLASALAKKPISTLLSTLERLGQKRIKLAFPLRQALLTGPLYEAVTKTIKEGKDIQRLCAAITCLDSSGLAATLAWAMRSSTIPATPSALLCAAELAPHDDKSTSDLLRAGMTKKPAIRAAMRGFRKRNWPKTGYAAGRILTQQPKLAAIATMEVIGFGRADFDETLAHLQGDVRSEFLSRAFALLCELDPFFARQALLAATDNNAKTTNRVLDVLELPDTTLPEPTLPPVSQQTTQDKSSGFFGKLLGGNKDVVKFLDGKKKNKDKDLSGAVLENEILSDREMVGMKMANSQFSESSLTRCLVTDTVLMESKFTSTTFEDSIFRQVDFSESFFEKCSFFNCVFEECNFGLAGFRHVRFKNCRFSSCAMPETTMLLCRFKYCRLAATSLAGSDIRDTIIKVTNLDQCDLTGATLAQCPILGVVFARVILEKTELRTCSLTSVTLERCRTSEARVFSPDGTPPSLLEAREAMLEQMNPPPAKTPSFTNDDLPLLEKVLRRWATELDYARRERIMLSNNQRRRYLSLRKAQAGANFVKMLPLLLHTDLFEQRDGLTDIPACNVAGYYPGFEELDLAAQHFSKIASSRKAPSISILGIYSIGSFGTVAQTASSDLDCWVCIEDRGATPKSIERLSVKLQALELWAMSEFKLELHFFLMKMSAVRANDFGLSDEESSGSAQAQLLKEEFYRTALKLAGHDLAWWYVEPGVNAADYHRHMEALTTYPLGGSPKVEDFGHMDHMPAEEFFGASLWQIVKALHSPFKSVLKLGVLEMYSSSKQDYLPLCDRIKDNLFSGQSSFLKLDPYALLFSELKGFYAVRNNEEVVRLLTEAFLLKADLTNVSFFCRHPAMRIERDLLWDLFGGYAAPELVRCGGEKWSFEKSLAVGRSVQRFMVDAYKRIREALKESKTTHAITPEDMTRLGRRVGSLFSVKKTKIARIPFVDVEDDGFPVLHFSAMKSPTKAPLWVVRGTHKYDPKSSLKDMQVLLTNREPVMLFAWLMANRLYQPRGVILADRSISPLGVADIQDGLTALWDFFPFEEVFERNMEDGLQPERITRAYFINNLGVPAKETEIKVCSIVYATNWGEMFCETFTDPEKDLPYKPGLFMETHLPHQATVRTVIDYWMPHGARCPKILV